MKIILKITVFLNSVLFCLSACGQTIEDDAKVLATYLEQLRAEITEFTTFRDSLAKLRITNINGTDLLGAQQRQEIEMTIARWTLSKADAERAQLFEGVRKTTALAIQQRIDMEARIAANKKLVDDAKNAVDVQVAKLGEASRSLLQLTKAPSLKDNVAFYSCFFKAVRSQTQKLQSEAQIVTDPKTKPPASSADSPAGVDTSAQSNC